MSPSVTTEKITLTYPVFAADFLDSDRLVVAGGGGEGHSGVGNKITLLDVSKSTATNSDTETNIKRIVEHALNREEDSCMSLAVVRAADSTCKSENKKTEAVIVTGINSGEKSLLESRNEHFRTFSVTSESIKLKSQHQLFTPSSDVEIFQRVLRSRGSLVALATGHGLVSRGNFEIVVANAVDASVHRRISTDAEVADLDLCDDGSLAYCTAKDIFVTPATSRTDPRKLSWQPTAPIQGSLRSVRFLGPERLLAVLNHPRKSGAELILFDASSGTIVSRQKLHSGIKGVSSLDAVPLSRGGDSAVAVAGADQSIELITINSSGRIRRTAVHRDVHPFPISKVAFSQPPAPEPTQDIADDAAQKTAVIRLATTSLGNTVVVFTLELVSDGRGGYCLAGSHAKQAAVSVLLSLLMVVVFAVLLQVVFIKRAGLPFMEWGGLKQQIGDAVGDVIRGDAAEGLLKGMNAGSTSDTFNFDSGEYVIGELADSDHIVRVNVVKHGEEPEVEVVVNVEGKQTHVV